MGRRPENSPTRSRFTRRSSETAVGIEAPSDKVWDVIVDFDRYGEWNPFILEARGKAAAGQTL
ncbi:SRPBCC family protein [Streptomyces lydicus]|uniref:SRPBCC family protein n=1 Tax=Streptomyces lydicus TaxID=47763 RepID=UPI0013E93F45|nr:SRPBCC family protein [Streptomyces lydicus]MCZ1008983.1 SRPBCC family protein [Streptomyces lydicus]